MKKLFTYILVICCVCCLFAGLVACGKTDSSTDPSDNSGNETEKDGNNTDPSDNSGNETGKDGDNQGTSAEKIAYTVFVACDNNEVLSGIKVKLEDLQGKAVTEEVAAGSGIANLKAVAGTYNVVVSGVPEEYEASEEIVTATAKTAKVEITLKSDKNPVVNKIKYKITLTMPDGTPVKGIAVQLCDIKGGCQFSITDENGVAIIERDAGNYEIHIDPNLVPQGYTFDNTAYKVTDADTEKTVAFEVESEPVAYSVTLKYPDGSGADGKTITLSYGSVNASATTKDGGVAVFNLPMRTYNISVVASEIPEGYIFDASAYTVTKNDREITVYYSLKPINYIVFVSCEESAMLSGLKVKIVDENGVDASEALSASSGMVMFSAPPAKYTVSVIGLPDNYEVTEGVLTDTAKQARIEVKEKKETGTENDKTVYKVTLTMPDGTPVEGKHIMLATDKVSITQKTNSEGVAIFNLKADNYEATLIASEIPAGYTYSKSMLTEIKKEITIMYEAPKTVDYTVTVIYSKDKKGASGLEVALYDDGVEVGTGVTNNSGKVKIKAERKDYLVKIKNCPADYAYITTLIIEPHDPVLTLELTEIGTSAYAPRELIEGTNTVKIGSGLRTGIWFIFDFCSKPGKYSIETVGSHTTNCKHYQGALGNVNSAEMTEKDSEYFSYKANKSSSDKNFYMTFGILPENAIGGNQYLFYISATDVNKADDFTIVIKHVEQIAETQIIEVKPKAKQIISDFTLEGEYEFVMLNPSVDKVVYNENDGLYHLNTSDGPVICVVVDSQKYFATGFSESFIKATEGGEMGEGGASYIVYNIDKDAGVIERCDYLDFIKEYAESCKKSEGLHPLTEEWHYFLQNYAATQRLDKWLDWKNDENLYMYACGYCVYIK